MAPSIISPQAWELTLLALLTSVLMLRLFPLEPQTLEVEPQCLQELGPLFPRIFDPWWVLRGKEEWPEDFQEEPKGPLCIFPMLMLLKGL